MGQQQLLLVILVTIIVGIATVVAINTFSSAADGANLDAVRNDLVSIAAAAQSYHMKPVMMGGGGRDFSGVTFSSFAVPGTVSEDGETLTNENGVYTIMTKAGDVLTIQGVPTSPDNPTLVISNETGEDVSDFSISEVAAGSET